MWVTLPRSYGRDTFYNGTMGHTHTHITSRSSSRNMDGNETRPKTWPFPLLNMLHYNNFSTILELFYLWFFIFIFDDWVHILFCCSQLSHGPNLVLEDIDISFLPFSLSLDKHTHTHTHTQYSYDGLDPPMNTHYPLQNNIAKQQKFVN